MTTRKSDGRLCLHRRKIAFRQLFRTESKISIINKYDALVCYHILPIHHLCTNLYLPQTSNMQHRKPTQAESLMAGVVAGAVEGFATYPAEFVKTKAQFSSSSSTKVGLVNPLTYELKADALVSRYSGYHSRYHPNTRSDRTLLRLGRTGCRKWIKGWCPVHVVRYHQGDAP